MIATHEHQWVPWDAKKISVCDESGCDAAIRWNRKGIIDWREHEREWGSVTEPTLAEKIEDVRSTHGDVAADLVANGWTVDGALNHVEGTCDILICTHPDHYDVFN